MPKSELEFGIRHIPTEEIFEGFSLEVDALTWLAKASIPTNECESVRREIVWSDWQPVHPQ